MIGGYRVVFATNYTLALTLEGNLYTKNELSKTLSHNAPFDIIPVKNRLRKNSDVIANLSFGKIFAERYHISLGLGLAAAKFRQQFDTTIDGIPPTSIKTSQTKFGFVPSLKGEYAATQNISLIGNISYEIYKKINKAFPNGFSEGLSYSSSISPRYLAIKLGAIYKF